MWLHRKKINLCLFLFSSRIQPSSHFSRSLSLRVSENSKYPSNFSNPSEPISPLAAEKAEEQKKIKEIPPHSISIANRGRTRTPIYIGFLARSIPSPVFRPEQLIGPGILPRLGQLVFVPIPFLDGQSNPLGIVVFFPERRRRLLAISSSMMMLLLLVPRSSRILGAIRLEGLASPARLILIARLPRALATPRTSTLLLLLLKPRAWTLRRGWQPLSDYYLVLLVPICRRRRRSSSTLV